MVAAPPLIGSAVSFLRDPLRFFLREYRRHGPVFRVRIGGRRFTVLCGPEAARWVTRHETEFLTVAGIYDNIHRLVQSDPEVSMMCQDGPRHAELRKWNKRGMSRSYAEEHIDVSLGVANDVIDRMSGARVDVVDLAKSLVYEQLGMTMTGSAPPELLGDCRRLIDAVINAIRFPATRHLPIRPNVRESYRRVDAFSRALTREHAGGPAPGAPALFIHDILAGVDRGLCEPRHVPSVILGPYLAGLDTLAHQLAFAAWAMVDNPRALERVRHDADRLFAGGPPTAQDVRSATALRGAAMEALRLYPISPGQLRRVARDVVLDGHQLRKGDDIMLPHAMPHFMAEYFPRPETFDIDRYGPDRAEHRTPGAYVPYGLGRHICLGAGTADFLLMVNLASLVHRCDIAAERGYALRVRWLSSGMPHKFRATFAPRRPRSRATPRPAVPPSGCPVAHA